MKFDKNTAIDLSDEGDMVNPSNNHLSISAMVCFAAALLIAIIVIVSSPTQAQDTAPAWEYAILVYGNDDARVHTGDTETDSALTGLLVPQDSNASNIALALNVMGNDGWDLVNFIPGGSTLYMFKRPKD